MADIYRKAKSITLYDSKVHIMKSSVDLSDAPLGSPDFCRPDINDSFYFQPDGYVILELDVSIPCAGMVHVRTTNRCFDDAPGDAPYIEESTHCGSFTVAWE